VTVYASGRWGPSGGEVAYLVLEWLQDLGEYLQRRRAGGDARVGEAQAWALLRSVVEGLGLAHRKRIAHRDIKPGNVFLASTDVGQQVKVLDFGIAKAMQDGLEFGVRRCPASVRRVSDTDRPFRGWGEMRPAGERLHGGTVRARFLAWSSMMRRARHTKGVDWNRSRLSEHVGSTDGGGDRSALGKGVPW